MIQRYYGRGAGMMDEVHVVDTPIGKLQAFAGDFDDAAAMLMPGCYMGRFHHNRNLFRPLRPRMSEGYRPAPIPTGARPQF
jgi:hypothetical protein